MPELLERTPSEKDSELDRIVFAELVQLRQDKELAQPQAAFAPEPDVVDLSKYLRFIRCQGGPGCWGYSLLAVWDIMNEMVCPYSPNLSMRIWMMLHKRRDLWEKAGGLLTPDGRYHQLKNPEFGFFQSFGNTTEGTEPTLDPPYPSENWAGGGWSTEGINEASNWKLSGDPKPIEVSSISFIRWLAEGRPIRLNLSWLSGGGHFEAVVGYDKMTQTFKYLNSVGDKWGDNGFATYTFQEIDNKKCADCTFDGAEVIEIVPPKPVPAARIEFHHTVRANVLLHLGVEDSPKPPNRIWPHGWDDNSRNLNLTVRLPAGFIWPPQSGNRLFLDVYDSGTYSQDGGEVVEFTAAFGGDVRHSSQLLGGPVKFGAREYRRLYLP